MLKKSLFVFLGTMGIWWASSGPGFADRRSYVWTYEYMTMPKGRWELENYVTMKVPDRDRARVNALEEQLELEYGLTDHLDVAMYQTGSLKNTGSGSMFGYDGFKVRARCRFSERGRFFVDPEIYFEYIRDGDLSRPNIGEAKIILSKDMGKLNFSYNQIMERDLARRGKTGQEYAVGTSYEFWPALKAGLESKGDYLNGEYALGPVFSWATGRLWVACGALFGLNKRTNDIQTRVVIGILF